MIYDILPVNNYDGNGSTTTFDFDFYIDSADEIKVYLFSSDGTKNLLVNEVDYQIHEVKNPSGSYITYPIAGSTHTVLSSDEKISLQMYLPLSQETQYNNSSLLNLSALEYSFDYLTRLIQIVARKIDLCIKAEEGEGVAPTEIINNVVTLGTSVLNRANAFATTLTTVENLASSATQMYNTVIADAQTITNLQNSVNTLTTSKVNTSGDNFASSVKAIDGQWVYPNSTIAYFELDNTSNSKQTFSLSSFLPNDTYSYEVQISGIFHHSVSGGNNLGVYVKAQNNGSTPIPFLYSSSSASYQHNSIIVPIGSEREISFKTDSSGFTTAKIYLLAYRRIGSNT